MLYTFLFDRLENKNGSGILYAIKDKGYWRYSYHRKSGPKLNNYELEEYYCWTPPDDSVRERKVR